MLESLTVMGVDSEDSRERRAPWGVLKFLKAREKNRPRAVSIELDKLMLWVPAPCAVEIVKDMATTSVNTSRNYKVERGSADPASGRRFSFLLSECEEQISDAQSYAESVSFGWLLF